MALNATDIANLALARLGAKRIDDIATGDSVEAIQCQRHYGPARDALLRAHAWNFALARVALVEDASTPAFEWGYQFVLPTDCLRVLRIEDSATEYVIEGRLLLTDAETVNIVYVRSVIDPAQFDPIFVDVLALDLAMKLAMPLSQDKAAVQLLGQERVSLMSRARMVNAMEAPPVREGLSWNEARHARI